MVNWDSKNEENVNQRNLVPFEKWKETSISKTVLDMAEMYLGGCQLLFRRNPGWEPHPGAESKNTEV